MILWLILFLIIVGISFLLAIQSMKDFQEKPSNLGRYSLFLIRKPEKLTSELLDNLHKAILKTGHIVTIERLFKGNKSAFVIFGPREFLEKAGDFLSLLELEEYTNVNPENTVAWEVSTKDSLALHLYGADIFKNFPTLLQDEQIWCQFTIQSTDKHLWPNLEKPKNLSEFINKFFSGETERSNELRLQKILITSPNLKAVAEEKNKQKAYNAEIRLVVVSSNADRRKQLVSELESLDSGKMVKLPKPYTSAQILKAYKERSKSAFDKRGLRLISLEVLTLLGTPKV